MARADRQTERRTRAGGAFSLIEMLVVISIIAVLMGITLPVIARAREAARDTVCASNLKQVGLGVEMYLEQNKQVYPNAVYMPSPWLSRLRVEDDAVEATGDVFTQGAQGASGLPSFQRAMDTFLPEHSEVYKCPGDKWIYSTLVRETEPDGPIGGSSYTYVTWLAGRKLDDMQRGHFGSMQPNQFPIMHDFDNSPPVISDTEGGYETQDGRRVEAPYFHLSRNVLYADLIVRKPGLR